MRIDPLREDGTVDTAFFGSEDYKKYVERLRWYLKAEGFDTLDERIIIKMFDHTWYVEPYTKKP